MKRRIALAAGLLLTLGSAVAGSLLYGQQGASELAVVPESTEQVTPAMIATWKETSASGGYIAPRVPI